MRETERERHGIGEDERVESTENEEELEEEEDNDGVESREGAVADAG